MNNLKRGTMFILTLAFIVLIGSAADALAQGKSRGGGNSNAGGNRGGGGRPDISTPNRGGGRPDMNGTSSERGRGTMGNSETRRANAEDRQRRAQERMRDADRDMRDNPHWSDETKMNANDLRDGYQAALATNPDLKFGQYVAANMIARNMQRQGRNISSSDILAGLASGNSLGETLQDLGMSRDEAKRAEKETKEKMKRKNR